MSWCFRNMREKKTYWPLFLFIKFRKRSDVDQRTYLDRRRFEEGFLLYAVAKIQKKYKIKSTENITNRNNYIASILEEFYDSFMKRWGSKLVLYTA